MALGEPHERVIQPMKAAMNYMLVTAALGPTLEIILLSRLYNSMLGWGGWLSHLQNPFKISLFLPFFLPFLSFSLFRSLHMYVWLCVWVYVQISVGVHNVYVFLCIYACMNIEARRWSLVLFLKSYPCIYFETSALTVLELTK